MTALDRFIGGLLATGKWLVLPVALLLFLQWPLRDLVQGYSREANDLGQWLFALLVALSIVAATRARAHLGTDALARRYPAKIRRNLEIVSIIIGLAPWVLFVLATSATTVARSVGQLERFPDTLNPGYFLVKLAVLLMLLVVLAQALVDLSARRTEPGEPHS